MLSLNPIQSQIDKIIERAKSGWQCLLLEKIPFIGAIEEMWFGCVVFNRDLPSALKQFGFKFAEPLPAIRFCSASIEQRQYPFGLLFFDNDKQLWCLHLRGGAGQCCLRVYQHDPDDDWDETVHFLVVAV